MNNIDRRIRRFNLILIAPYAVGILLGAGLAQFSRWLGIAVVVAGIVASVGLHVMASRRVGPFADAPLLVGSFAGMELRWISLVGLIVILPTLLGPWFSSTTIRVTQGVLLVLTLIIPTLPMFGIGRAGRRMNDATKEHERASWRN